MKAWAKRMIWFSIVQITIFLSDVGIYLRGIQFSESSKFFTALIWLCILIIPLIAMEDDYD